jgi:hypothetical protein
MSTTEEPQEMPPISVWRRLLVGSGVLVLVFVVLGVSRWGYERSRVASRLDSALAGLDETDPRWRLDDLERDRPEPPEGKNSARVVLAAVKLLPRGWPDPKFDEKLEGVPPPELLDDDRRKALDDELKRAGRAVEAARRLAGMPEGRHRLTIAPNPIGTLLQDQQDTRQACTLLRYDAWRLALDRDVDAALRSSRACLNGARSLDDEPFIISQLIRTACVSVALESAQRSLALGEAGGPELAELAGLLELEVKHPSLLVGLRGERAILQRIFDDLATGAISSKEMLAMMRDGPDLDWRDQLFGISRAEVRRQQPEMLKVMSEMVEIARRPPQEQAAAMKAVEARLGQMKRSQRLIRLFVPAVAKASQSFRRKVASLEAMRVLVAAERYRLKNGRWPGKLEELAPGLLPRVPLDPYDGKPIRYRRLPDGVVAYGLGDDGKDDGGQVERAATGGPPPDVGYRLWDVKHRRQPPRPKAPEPAAGGLLPGAAAPGGAPAPPPKP